MQCDVKINVNVADDKGDFSHAVELATRYVENDNCIAIVGHWYSDICLSLTDIYERGEKVLVVPTVSLTNLVDENSEYVYQNIPNDSFGAKVLCDYAVSQNKKNAVIYYEDSNYGFNMASKLEQYAYDSGINVIDKLSNMDFKNDMYLAKNRWELMEFDCVFLISNSDEGIEFIEYYEEEGMSNPIYCSDGMDNNMVNEVLCDTNMDIVVHTIYDPNNKSKGMIEFDEIYNQMFHDVPDIWAYQGYDSVMIIADAIVESGVRTSQELKEYFDNTENIKSVYGNGKISFDENNMVNGKKIYIKNISNFNENLGDNDVNN